MISVSSPKEEKRGRKSGMPWWLSFPPTLLLPIAALFYVIGNPMRRFRASPSFALFFGMIYVALSVAHYILSSKGNLKGANAAALLANGALVVFLDDLMGGPAVFNLVGGVLFFFGLINIMGLLSPPPAARFARESNSILPAGTDRSVARRILDAIVFPAAFLEFDDRGEERVIVSNEPFAAVLGRSADKVRGVAFSSLIPPHQEGAKFRFLDTEWSASRTTKGKQTLFMLSPLEKAAEPPIVQVLSAIDADTGLFTRSFLEYKGKSDVEGCRRYKRRLALALFRLDFDRQGSIPPSDEARKTASDTFGRMVSGTIRDCDSAYRISDTEVLLFMPDTAPQGAKVAITRIRENTRKLAALECPELAAAELTEGAVNFFGEDAQSLDHVIEEAYFTISRGSKAREALG